MGSRDRSGCFRVTVGRVLSSGADTGADAQPNKGNAHEQIMMILLVRCHLSYKTKGKKEHCFYFFFLFGKPGCV